MLDFVRFSPLYVPVEVRIRTKNGHLKLISFLCPGNQCHQGHTLAVLDNLEILRPLAFRLFIDHGSE